MRKLSLIAAVLMIPVIATAEYVIVETDFEDADPGQLDGQTLGGGFWETPFGDSPNVNIINDPTGAGRGQVAAFQHVEGTPMIVLWCTRTDKDQPGGPPPPAEVVPWGHVYYPYGCTTYEFDYYCTSNQGDWTNFMCHTCGPAVWQYWDPDGDVFQDEIDLHDGDAGFNTWNWADYTAQEGAGGPLPLDQWFSVRIVYHNRTSYPTNDPTDNTYDFYVNDQLMMSDVTAGYWYSHCLQWEFVTWDPFLPDTVGAGVGYVLIDKARWTWEVPEPGALAFAGFGVVLVLLRRRKE